MGDKDAMKAASTTTIRVGNDLYLRRMDADRDCDELRIIFHDAVMHTAAGHYSLKERLTWAEWSAHPLVAKRLLQEGLTLVAELNGMPVGFGQLNPMRYVRMLYVAPRFSRQGVASRMLGALETAAFYHGLTKLETHASLTSRPVFQRAGFSLEGPAPTQRDGVVLQRFSMCKHLMQ